MVTWTEFTDQPPSRVKNLLMEAFGFAGAAALTFPFWWGVWWIVFKVWG
jgi:hypothetical protein